MKGLFRTILRIGLPIGVIVIGIVISAGLSRFRPEPERGSLEAAIPRAEVVRVEPAPRTLEVRTDGTVRPFIETMLTPEVSGRIIEVSPNFKSGGFFEPGETLLRMDPTDYEVALSNAEAALAQAEALFEQEQARAEQALADWQSMGNEGAPPPLVAREPQLKQAQAQMEAAQASVKQARRNLERTHIAVPYAGIVRSKGADLGQIANLGTPLGTVFSTQRVEIRLPLSNEQVGYLSLPTSGAYWNEAADADKPRVTLTGRVSGRQGQWTGFIDRVEGALDPRSRFTYAVAIVEDPYGLQGQEGVLPLKVGAYVTATIRGRKIEEAYTVPRSALTAENSVLTAVFMGWGQAGARRDPFGEEDGPLSSFATWPGVPKPLLRAIMEGTLGHHAATDWIVEGLGAEPVFRIKRRAVTIEQAGTEEAVLSGGIEGESLVLSSTPAFFSPGMRVEPVLADGSAPGGASSIPTPLQTVADVDP